MIKILNLDKSFPITDSFHESNTAGVIRFTTGADSFSLPMFQRYQGDLVNRFIRHEKKINEVVTALNKGSSFGSSSSTSGVLSEPVLDTDPANKKYVDDGDKETNTVISVLAERLRQLRANISVSSGWTEVIWQTGEKQVVELTLLDDEGEEVLLNLDEATVVNLLIKTDVSRVSDTEPDPIPRYVYRTATYGGKTGIHFDDIWVEGSLLKAAIPSTSFYEQGYPHSSGYESITQPRRIWVKASVLTPQDLGSRYAEDLPDLNFSDPEIQAIIEEMLRVLCEEAVPCLNISDWESDVFKKAILIDENKRLWSLSKVLLNQKTLMLPDISQDEGHPVGVTPTGEMVKLSFGTADPETDYQALVTDGIKLYRGVVGETVNQEEVLNPSPSSGGLIVAEEKYPSGTNSPRGTAKVWNTRLLNSLRSDGGFDVNVDEDGGLRIGAGSYAVYHCSACAWRCGSNMVRIYNRSSGTTLLSGFSHKSSGGTDGGYSTTYSEVVGGFSVSEETVIELQQYVTQSNAPVAVGSGESEVYAAIVLKKLS